MIVWLLILWHRWLYVTSYTMPMNKGFECKYNQPNLFRNVEKEKSISKCWERKIYFIMLRKKNLFQNVEKEQSISECWERSVKGKPNLNFSRKIKNSYFDQHWAIPEKIQTGRVGAGGCEDIELPQRYWRKIMWKFWGQLKKK